MLFAILKTQKIHENDYLRKIREKFGRRTHRRTAHRQTAKRICRIVRSWFPENIVFNHKP